MTDFFQDEYRYRYLERIGIMCEDREPTPEQREFARQEAMRAIKELENDNE